MSAPELPENSLKEALDWIEAHFNSSHDDYTRMSGVLFLLSELFDNHGREDFANKLNEYSHWISDLADGVVHPIFKPKGKKRPPDPTLTWHKRAMVAVAVDAMMRSGMQRVEAAAWVARHCKALKPPLVGEASDLAAAALSWRDEFSKTASQRPTFLDVIEKKKKLRITNLSALWSYMRYARMLERVLEGQEQKAAEQLLKAVGTSAGRRPPRIPRS